ncbi:MAG TPA: polysaccharide biosynthesis/export family protein [Gemmatimonadota bacterium]|nr:polysaccharide biosynthesis/export family protein [Gemmatimonadota bacterium]
MRSIRVAFLLAGLFAPSILHAQADAPLSEGVEAKIVPGDMIRLNIWREPDLTGQFLVQEDGTAVLPRLGAVRVTEFTPSTLKQSLVAEFGKTLRNPSVEVVVLRRILITGEVGAEGVYPVDPTMSLVEVLTLAGGPTPNAKSDRVILIRQGEEIEIDLDEPLDVRNVALQSGDQLLVPRAIGWMRNWKVMLGVVSSTISLYALITR